MNLHVIQIVGALAPESGGTARSVPLLSQALAAREFHIHLISFDLGQKFSKPLIPEHEYLNVSLLPTRIRIGMRPIYTPGFRDTLLDLIKEYSPVVLHVHGLWLPYLGTAVKIGQSKNSKLVISPRGMLTSWSQNYRGIRKAAAWRLYQQNWLKQADLIHATSPGEAEEITNLLPGLPVAVIPNGTILPGPGLMQTELKDQNQVKKILFLSRIHPKKGLLNLVKAAQTLDLKGWKFIICGYDEANHQQEVIRAVADADLDDKFSFHGPVDNQRKWSLYQQSDLFILPSFSENYGVVVAEALASGIPVITTQGTPWEDLVQHQCGWWVKPDPSSLAAALQDALNMSDQERAQMGMRGRELIKRKYTWKVIADQFTKIYSSLLDKETLSAGLINSPEVEASDGK